MYIYVFVLKMLSRLTSKKRELIARFELHDTLMMSLFVGMKSERRDRGGRISRRILRPMVVWLEGMKWGIVSNSSKNPNSILSRYRIDGWNLYQTQ